MKLRDRLRFHLGSLLIFIMALAVLLGARHVVQLRWAYLRARAEQHRTRQQEIGEQIQGLRQQVRALPGGIDPYLREISKGERAYKFHDQIRRDYESRWW